MAKMNTNFKNLQSRILSASSSCGYIKIQDLMSRICGNVMVAGTGGSYAVAEYINSILKKENKCFSNAYFSRELFFQNLETVDYVILITYSGKTHEIIECIKYCRQYKNIREIIVITRDDELLFEKVEKFDKLNVIKYKNSDTKEKSFISIASSFMPMSLFAKFLVEEQRIDFDKYIKEIFENVESEIRETIKDIDFSILRSNPVIEILYESEVKSAAQMLESNLVETGIAYPVLHEKKHFSHGRSILGYSKKTPITIWLKNSGEIRYDKVLKKYLNQIAGDRDFIILDNVRNDLIGEFEMLIKVMYLTKVIAEKVNIDVSRIEYPKEIVDFYHYNKELV